MFFSANARQWGASLVLNRATLVMGKNHPFQREWIVVVVRYALRKIYLEHSTWRIMKNGLGCDGTFAYLFHTQLLR